ncbi:MAG: hypothetical protein WBX01_05520 [Nitrososphaeraceae archaeon]
MNKVERTITPEGETVTEEQKFSSGESSHSAVEQEIEQEIEDVDDGPN